MKKALFRGFASIVLVAGLFFASCANSVSDSENSSQKLQDLINNADKELDLGGKKFDSDVNVGKALTISNADLGGKTVRINSEGVTLKNISNAKIIVGQKVGNGDFTMDNCTTGIDQLTVYGGGSESIHIKSSKIKNVCASKAKVRIVLEGATEITAVEVKEDVVKFVSEASAKISKISVSSEVKTLNIDGGSIEKIITKSSITVNVLTKTTKITTIKSAGTVSITKENGMDEEPAVLNNQNVDDEYSSVEEPEVLEGELEETLKIVFEECTDGIKGHVENLDGTKVELKSGTASNGDKYGEDLRINVDNQFIGWASDTDFEFFYPFVESGKEVKVVANVTREAYDKDGEQIYSKTVRSGVAKTTPVSGKGKLIATGDMEYTYSEDGTITVTKMPEINQKDLDWSVVMDFASGKNWDEGGCWVGNIEITKTGSYNVYMDGSCQTTKGFEQGFVGGYVSFPYEYEGKTWGLRTSNGFFNEEKFNLKLLSVEESRKKLTSAIKMQILDAEKGIEVKFKKDDGEIYDIWNTNDIWNIHRGNYQEWVEIYIDDKLVIKNDSDKFNFIPFVEAGKPLNIKAKHYGYAYSYGLGYRKFIINEFEETYTPKTGYGKIEVTKGIEYTADDYGNITITQVPELKFSEGLTENWRLYFSFKCEHERYEDGYSIGTLYVSSSELKDGVKINYFDDNYSDTDQYNNVSICPEIEVHGYEDDSSVMILSDEKINVYKKNLELIKK